MVLGKKATPSTRRLSCPLRGVVDWSLDARNSCRLVVAVAVGLAARPEAVVVVGRGAKGRAPGQVVVVGLSNLVQVAATRPVAVEVVVLGRGLVVHTTATGGAVEVVVLGEVGVAVEVVVLGRGLVVYFAGAAVDVVVLGEVGVAVDVVVLGRGLVVYTAAVGTGAAVEVVVLGVVGVAVEAVVVGLRAAMDDKAAAAARGGRSSGRVSRLPDRARAYIRG